MSAYSTALAGESVHDDLKVKFDSDSEVFNGVTHDDLERYARTVAYKVAHNLSNGHKMDPSMNPLDVPVSETVMGEKEDSGDGPSFEEGV